MFPLFLGGCAVTSPSGSAPQYLQGEIQQHPPATNGLTAYAANGPFGGDVLCLARSGNENSIFAGTFNGNIFLSVDGGATWTQTGTNLNGGPIYDLISVNNLLFAATSNGIFRSADKGLSWQPVGVEGSARVPARKFLLSGKRLLVATEGGIELSDQQGTSWSHFQIPNLNNPDIIGDPKLLSSGGDYFLVAVDDYVLVNHGFHVFRSKDLGEWEPADHGLEFFTSNSVDYPLYSLVAVGSTLFAVMAQDSVGNTGLYSSTDKGASWQLIQESSVKDVNAAYTAGDSLFINTGETDTGKTLRRKVNSEWLDLGYPSPGSAIYDLLLINDTVIVATGGGIYIRDNRTGRWLENNRGIRAGMSPKGMIITAEQDFVVSDSSLYRSSDHGETWSLMSDAFKRGDAALIDPLLVHDIDALGGWLFIATNNGLYRGQLGGDVFYRVESLPAVDKTGGEQD
jgi:hypothetical protein